MLAPVVCPVLPTVGPDPASFALAALPSVLQGPACAAPTLKIRAAQPARMSPLIPSTMPAETVENFGGQVPMKRPGQPVELVTSYVMLADPLSSYVSGATIAVTGGKPFL